MSYGHNDKYLEVIDMTSQNDSNAKDTIDTFIDPDNTEDKMVDGMSQGVIFFLTSCGSSGDCQLFL